MVLGTGAKMDIEMQSFKQQAYDRKTLRERIGHGILRVFVTKIDCGGTIIYLPLLFPGVIALAGVALYYIINYIIHASSGPISTPIPAPSFIPVPQVFPTGIDSRQAVWLPEVQIVNAFGSLKTAFVGALGEPQIVNPLPFIWRIPEAAIIDIIPRVRALIQLN